jgi:hypothetical protein
MFGKYLFGSLGVTFIALVACSERADEGRGSNEDGRSGNAGAAGDESATGGDRAVTGGRAGSGSGGSSSGGGSTAGGRMSTGGGASPTGGSNPSGDGGNEAGGETGITDAGLEDAPSDAASDAPEPPQCLGSGDACGEDAGTCCEAYACRAGKCCTPNGVWSNCISGSDCCSGNCVLNQCTCVPRGYSCNGAGSCCSGYACVNGTCICPPDIRGC